MKRWLALALSLVLALGCAVPALAVEEPLSETPGIGAADWDDGAWDEETWLVSVKEMMGMPFPEGINVSVNGTYLELDGVAPVVRQNRTMVPFRAFFEEQGTTVDYNNGVITAQLADGRQLTLQLNSTVMTVRGTDGESKQMDMGVAPYLDGAAGRTYIPVRFAGEAMGYDVEWDDQYQVAVLTNWEEVIAALDSHYTVFNDILAASYSVYDVDKNYQIRENMNVAGTLYGENRNDTATFGVSLSALMSGDFKQMSMDMSGTMNLGGLKDTLFANLDEETQDVLSAISNVKLSTIMNMEQGDMYMKVSGAEGLGDLGVENDTWYHTNTGDVSQDYDLMMSNLRTMTMGQLLVSMGQSQENLAQADQILNLLVGDDCWSKTTSGDVTTYTNKLDTMTLVNRVMKALATGGMTLEDLGVDTASLPKVDLSMMYRIQNGKLMESTCKGTVDFTGTAPLTIGVDSTYRNGVGKASFDVTGTYVGKIVVTTDATVSATSQTVPSAPPAGQKVLELG